VLRYETLGRVSRKQAAQTLVEKIAAAGGKAVIRSRATFRTVSEQWLKTVLPMYKASTQKNHRHIVGKHLCPRFGEQPMSAITRQEVQAYVAHLAQAGYAPKTVDHIHDVLSAILRTAVGWGHLEDNPARGVRLPRLRTVRPKWALTTTQAATLLEALAPLPRAMVGLALLSGVRRGELFALRWQDVDEEARVLHIREAVYEGTFGTPKTEAGLREIPLSDAAMQYITEWKRQAKGVEPERLVFATRSGKPISPNNVLRRWIVPACAAQGLANATWLTFRRTYSSWAHQNGVPAKIVARVMGHAKVDTTLNVYTQVIEGSERAAVETVGAELFRIVQSPVGTTALIH
jgi:integrase